MRLARFYTYAVFSMIFFSCNSSGAKNALGGGEESPRKDMVTRVVASNDPVGMRVGTLLGAGPWVLVGDSMGAGVLANTRVGVKPNSHVSRALVTAFTSQRSLGFFDKQFRQPDLSGLGGSGPEHLPARLRAWTGLNELRVANVSHSGRKWSDALDMARDDAPVALGGEKPAGFILALGANDLCAGKELSDIARDASATLDYIESTYPGTPVAIVPPPPLHETRSVEGNIAVEAFFIPFNVSCKKVRERICRQINAEGLERKHAALRETLTEVAQSRSGGVVVLPSVSRSHLGREDLALDCFHPSAEGQMQMARAVFDDMKVWLSEPLKNKSMTVSSADESSHAASR